MYAILPEDAKNKINGLKSFICLWNPKRNIASPFLKDIVEASLKNNILIIEYVSKSKNKKREVKPIGVYAYDGLWYMPAFDLEKNKVLLFRVDRIVSLEVSERTYQFPMNLTDWFDSYTVKTPIRLYVQLTREGIRQCRSNSWLEPHIVVNDDENGYIDTIIDRNEIDFVSNYFVQLGTYAKVIEPQEIVNNIKRLAYRLLNHYMQT